MKKIKNHFFSLLLPGLLLSFAACTPETPPEPTPTPTIVLTVPEDNNKDGTPEPKANYGITDPDYLNYEQKYLLSKCPEYFGLNAADGLDVYVCQFAAESYYFYLFEHADTQMDRTAFFSMKVWTDAASMRLILGSYDVTREDITVVPFQHPFSSYIGPHMIIPAGTSAEEAQTWQEEAHAKYKEQILDMLFGEVKLSPPLYASRQFDVDGDGTIEHCTLGFGLTPDRFSFTFSASEGTIGDWKQKYCNVIYSDWYKQLSFVDCEDGVIRIQGIDQKEEIHLFDISIVDGNVHLTENGIPIGEVAETKHLRILFYIVTRPCLGC